MLTRAGILLVGIFAGAVRVSPSQIGMESQWESLNLRNAAKPPACSDIDGGKDGRSGEDLMSTGLLATAPASPSALIFTYKRLDR